MYLNKKNILDRIDSYSIIEEFFDEFTLDYAICSPLREDNKPSFGFFENNEAEIMYKDYGTNDCGDVFKFLTLYWDKSYEQVYEHINAHFNLGLIKRPSSLDLDALNAVGEYKEIEFTRIEKVKKERFEIKYFIEYRELDDFYDSYHISKEIQHKHVKQAQRVIKQKGKQLTIEYQYNAKNPCYVYEEQYEAQTYHKLYKPYTKQDDKFRNNYPYGVIENYNNLPEFGNILIITKSKKDIMVLEELGYDCICPTSENSYYPILNKKDELSMRFKYIIVYTDNDEAGVKASINITTETGWYYINNPKTEPKDPSDYAKQYGLQALCDFMEMKLNFINESEYENTELPF